MAIGDPKTDTKEAKRKRAIRYKKTGPKKYSPGFFAMFTTTPTQAADRRSSAASVLSKIFEESPRSAKARAKAKEKSKKTTVSDEQKRRQGKSGPSRKTTVSDAQKKRQTMKLPKSPPKRLKKNLDKPTSQTVKKPESKKPESKKSEEMYHQINTQTGKVDFSKPKVTAAKRLEQEDKYKAYKRINKTAKQSLKKKGK